MSSVGLTPSTPFARLLSPALVGILNITPDSFSDGGRFLDPQAAAAQARLLVSQGAQMLDIGAEASSFFREGVAPVPPHEQINRLLPVLALLRDLPVVVSVDTRSSVVADAVLRGGAHVINDISAGTHDVMLLRVVARMRAGIILMHMGAGFPATPASDDANIVETVQKYLAERAIAAMRVGIPSARIALDPGIGFGKTMADNWRLAARCREVSPLFPLMLGASRKRFLETLPPSDVERPASWPDHEKDLASHAQHPRDAGSALVTALAVSRGVEMHRVHDVALAAKALSIYL